jgi:hypothetical protein
MGTPLQMNLMKETLRERRQLTPAELAERMGELKVQKKAEVRAVRKSCLWRSVC